MTTFDINVEKLEFTKNKFSETQLVLHVYGTDINNFVLNSLRKVCTDQVPVYAFGKNGIKILRDSSVFDRTELEMTLCTLPIFNIDYDIKFLPYKYYSNPDEYYLNTKKIEYYINVKNNEFETIRDVTTNDLSISIDDNHIENNTMYDQNCPISLFKLNYGQEVEMSMVAKLGVGEMNGIFNASHTWFYEIYKEYEEDKNDPELIKYVKMIEKDNKKNKNKNEQVHYVLVIESSGQLNEFEIVKRGIENIIEKLNNIKNDINTNHLINIGSNDNIILDFENEDFTCIGQLNYLLQNDKDIAKSGANKPNLLEKRINLCLLTNNNKNFLEILNRNIDKTIEYYKLLLEKVKNIN
jgi:DNA-directed RNA polymerase subunit L